LIKKKNLSAQCAC